MPEDELVRRGLAGRSDFDHAPSRDIRIEQIRKLQERLSFRALEAPHKVALIVSAHAHERAGAERAAQDARGAAARHRARARHLGADRLLAHHPQPLRQGAVRPALRRSCWPPSSSQTKKVEPALAAQVAAMASGSLSRALELDVETLAQRKEIIERYEALVAHRRARLARTWPRRSPRTAPRPRRRSSVLEMWTRDVAVAQVGRRAPRERATWSPSRCAAAERLSPVGAPAAGSRCSSAPRVAIGQRNGGPRLQLERMFIELHSA